MVPFYGSLGDYGGYPWKLSASRLRVKVSMNDMKYSLIKPFWLEMVIDDFIWKWEMDFGKIFSSQIISSNVDADFWLISRFVLGIKRWMMVGK